MPDVFRHAPPPGLLLASDLGPRCDRALERTKQLAAEFRVPVEVIAVHQPARTPGDVLPWMEGGDALAREEGAARAEVDREFAGSGLRAQLRFATGQVDDAIVQAAATLPGWLVVTGSARGGGFARALLGSTVERVARTLAQALLVVRRRVRGPYRSILVGVDGSDASRRALQLAAALFPDRPIVAFHVREGMAALDDEVAAEVDLERFVDACGLAPGARANVEVAVGEGGPEAVLARYVRANAIDLAVLGLRDEPVLRRLLMGSRSEQLLQDFACDTLLVPDAGRARDD